MSAVIERLSTYHQPQESSYLRKKNRKTLGSEAFNLEYDVQPTRGELRRDIVSYLGEYRLQVQRYSYNLVFGRDNDRRGPITLRDQDRGEAIQHKTKRVIEERTRKGDPTHREKAEDVGTTLLNDRLRYAQTGDTVVWASPPGPKDQGYGDYGFIYVGNVTKQSNGEAKLAMQAIRVENPTIEQYNKAMSALTGEKFDKKKADEFLSEPKVVRKQLQGREVDEVLQGNFDFKGDSKEKEKTAAIVKQMEPLIEDFLDVMGGASDARKLKAFYTLENYALQLKEESENEEQVVYRSAVSLDDLEDSLSYKPPVAKGSCGSTGGSSGGMASNSLMSGGGGAGKKVLGWIFGYDQYGARAFPCPSCGSINVRNNNEMIANCQSCRSPEVGC